MNFKVGFKLVWILILMICHSTLSAQIHKRLIIDKINSNYTKTLKLPVNARIVTISDDIIILKIDSISNNLIYGNSGKDSISLSQIKCIHTRGLIEFIKFTALTGSSAYMAGLLIFSVYALNYPIFKDSPNGNIAYVGLGFTGLFAGLSTLIYHYPRTRFPSKKFHFKTE